jgi:hypothetical protein
MPKSDAPQTTWPETIPTATEAVVGAPRTTFRGLRMAGLSNGEAANLTAHLTGLRIGPSPWTVREIENLLFVRSMVEAGRLGS